MFKPKLKIPFVWQFRVLNGVIYLQRELEDNIRYLNGTVKDSFLDGIYSLDLTTFELKLIKNCQILNWGIFNNEVYIAQKQNDYSTSAVINYNPQNEIFSILEGNYSNIYISESYMKSFNLNKDIATNGKIENYIYNSYSGQIFVLSTGGVHFLNTHIRFIERWSKLEAFDDNGVSIWKLDLYEKIKANDLQEIKFNRNILVDDRYLVFFDNQPNKSSLVCIKTSGEYLWHKLNSEWNCFQTENGKFYALGYDLCTEIEISTGKIINQKSNKLKYENSKIFVLSNYCWIYEDFIFRLEISMQGRNSYCVAVLDRINLDFIILIDLSFEGEQVLLPNLMSYDLYYSRNMLFIRDTSNNFRIYELNLEEYKTH